MLLEIKDVKHALSEEEARVKANSCLSEEAIKKMVAKRLRINSQELRSVRIIKKSIDARKKDQIYIVYTFVAELPESAAFAKLINGKDTLAYELPPVHTPGYGSKSIEHRPIIIGSGPAGLFAGLILAENGYKPLILERGQDVDQRSADVHSFFSGGQFDGESNIQFGEGGAGTFSDGKLTTRIKDWRCDKVLEKLIEFGAPAEIGFINKPHIGTDILKQVVKNMRNRILQLGGEVRFCTKVTDIVIENTRVKAVVVNKNETISSNVVIAALGHSARDTYHMLYDRGVRMVSKPFAIGVRIEHPQEMIDHAQYGKFAGHPCLGAADYSLAYRSDSTGRSAYSFCMCPGGSVVAAASEDGMLVTNGMSEYKRDKQNANSALAVSIRTEDFESAHPLSGIAFQREWEKRAYQLGGSNFYAPVQLVGDFLDNMKSRAICSIQPSYLPGFDLCNLNECLPNYVAATLKEGLQDFDRKIKGFARRDAIMTGVETRTSAPLRIVRNENMESESTANLYPIGEGAGYAGGIVSAAVDGIKCAEKIMEQYKPL